MPLGMLKKYQESQRVQEDTFRIIDVKHAQFSKCKLLMQVIGKSITFECTPKEILSDDTFLESFSKKDIKTITYIANLKNQKPEYKIISQEFCEKFNRMLFKIKNQESNEWILKSAAEISLDKTLINRFSCEDIQAISYIAGCEHSLNDKIK